MIGPTYPAGSVLQRGGCRVQEQIHIADDALCVLEQCNQQHLQEVSRMTERHEDLLTERQHLMRALTEYDPSDPSCAHVETSDLKERLDAVEMEVLVVKERGRAMTQDPVFAFRLQVLHP
jgi:hypothetical protein